MEKENKVLKLFSLGLSVILVIVAVAAEIDVASLGIGVNTPFVNRFWYQFLHAHWLHALCNVWALLTLMFLFNVKDWQLLVAYIISAMVPGFMLCFTPAVGLSGLIYAVVGLIAFERSCTTLWLALTVVPILAGYLIPFFAASVHLWCFVVGLVVTAMITPFETIRSCFRK